VETSTRIIDESEHNVLDWRSPQPLGVDKRKMPLPVSQKVETPLLRDQLVRAFLINDFRKFGPLLTFLNLIYFICNILYPGIPMHKF